MSKTCAALLFAAFLSGPAAAQAPPISAEALQAFLREIGARDDASTRRTVALVVASAVRLAELQAAGSAGAAPFQAAFDKQLRKGAAVLNLLGSNSLDGVRLELAANLQRSFGPSSRPVDRFLGAVADRESLGGSSANLRDTVSLVIRVLASAGGRPGEVPAVDGLLVEAAAVLRVQGDDPLALHAIREDLGRHLP
ncbi:MAG: hypothetical protein IT158_10265 [Bryobacterales bacterium]|nr:hypothetical protein [Bryobacterales bacterium]